MKKIIFSCLVVLIMASACKQEVKKVPLEGTWKLVGYEALQDGKLISKMPGNTEISQLKTWSQEYFTFVGQSKTDTTVTDNYGWGIYKLNGNEFEETPMFHTNKSFIGSKVKLDFKMVNDTLIQHFKFDVFESTEKYLRVK